MKIKYPDYENCIVNLACSIRKEFGIAAENEKSLQVCDKLLQKQYKNIVVILLDGMGMSIMNKNLDKNGFFHSHLVEEYSSVFPPTTVAATTSMDSGLQPVQHSWLGWDCYYKEIDKNVTVFLNTESGTDNPAADDWVAHKYCGYQSIVAQIKEAGGQAYGATPFAEPYPNSFEAICQRIEELCALDGKKYIAAYWNEPDTTMHETGCYSQESAQLLQDLERQVEELCSHISGKSSVAGSAGEKLSDTLVIVTADHGHMDSDGVAIVDYPKIMECLVRMPSIEPRALNLFVKEGYEKQLEQEFEKEFGDKFILLTKSEVKEKKLFGTGEEHTQFDSMLGDYLAVAVDTLTIYNSREEKEQYVGVHAGLTDQEMRIPFIAIEL